MAAPEAPAGTPPKLVFHVTGFGRFRGVEVNPSSSIARRIAEEYRLNAPPRRAPYNLVEIRDSQILEVSGGGVDEYMTSLRTALESSADRDSAVHVLLHFGVAAGAPAFALEQAAYNTADFRVPDERGVQAAKAPIDPEEPLGTRHNTTLPVPALVERLADAGLPTVASQDPGRFICNWVFYRSCCLTEELNASAAATAAGNLKPEAVSPALRGSAGAAAQPGGATADAVSGAGAVLASALHGHAAAPRFHSLFCHVPSTETADMDVQLLLAVQLVCAIAEALHEGTDVFMRRHRPQPQAPSRARGLELDGPVDETPEAAAALEALLHGSLRGAAVGAAHTAVGGGGAGAGAGAGSGAAAAGGTFPFGLPPSAYGQAAGAGVRRSGSADGPAAGGDAVGDEDDDDDEGLYGPQQQPQPQRGLASAADADFAARLAAAKSGDVTALLSRPVGCESAKTSSASTSESASAEAVASAPREASSAATAAAPPSTRLASGAAATPDAAFEIALAEVAALGFEDALCRKALRATARSSSSAGGDAGAAASAAVSADAATAAAFPVPAAATYSVADAVDWIMAALESGEDAGLLQGEAGSEGSAAGSATDAPLLPASAVVSSNAQAAGSSSAAAGGRLPSFVVPGDVACSTTVGVRPCLDASGAPSTRGSLSSDDAASQVGSTPAASPQLRLPFSMPSVSPPPAPASQADRSGTAATALSDASSRAAGSSVSAQASPTASPLGAAPAPDVALQRGGSTFGAAAPVSASSSVSSAAPVTFELSSLLPGGSAASAPAAAGSVAQTLAALLAAATRQAPAAAAPHKMVIVVRQDLGMSPGKVAAQCCHAALKAVTTALRVSAAASAGAAHSASSGFNAGPGGAAPASVLADRVAVWQSQGEPIVVLKCDGLEHLRTLQETARALGLPTATIRDAGRTEVEPGTTTVMAIGPAPKGEIDAVTGALRLM